MFVYGARIHFVGVFLFFVQILRTHYTPTSIAQLMCRFGCCCYYTLSYIHIYVHINIILYTFFGISNNNGGRADVYVKVARATGH